MSSPPTFATRISSSRSRSRRCPIIPAASRPTAPRPLVGPTAASPPLRLLLLPISSPRFAVAASSHARLFHARAKRWRTVGGRSRWLASECLRGAGDGEGALYRAGGGAPGTDREGIAECELLRWFVTEHYILALGTAIMISAVLVPMMGGSDGDRVRVVQMLLFVTGIDTLLVAGGSYAFVIPVMAIVQDVSRSHT